MQSHMKANSTVGQWASCEPNTKEDSRVASCPCGSSGGFSELLKVHLLALEKYPRLSTVPSQDLCLPTQEYPLGNPWHLSSLSVLDFTGDMMLPRKKMK